MLASDLAFLLLGLLLGIPTGIALLHVIRGRPRAAREVRLTVTPDSVPRRRSATLASDPFAGPDEAVAAGGPADMEAASPAEAAFLDAPEPPARADDSERPADPPPSLEPSSTVVDAPSATVPDRTPVPTRPDSQAEHVGIQVTTGADPVLAAIRRRPDVDESEAAVTGTDWAAAAVDPTLDLEIASGPGIAPVTGPPATSGIALLEAAVRAREAARIEMPSGVPAGAGLAQPRPASGPPGPLARRMSGGDGSSRPTTNATIHASVTGSGPSATTASATTAAGATATASRAGGPAASDPTASGPAASRAIASGLTASGPTASGPSPTGSSPAAAPAAGTGLSTSGPCVEKRRATDELCSLANRMASQAAAASDALREAQRAYDQHQAGADQAAAVADPRAQRAAKDAAQHAFRSDRLGATSREAVEAAARTWLQEINRINQAARDAGTRMNQEREAARTMVATIERLSLEADAARVQAEAAAETCLNARQELADCEEEASAGQRTARMPLEPSLAPDASPASAATRRPVDAAGPSAPAASGATGKPGRSQADEIDEEADALAAAAARGGGQPAILQLLSGDRAALERLTGQLAANDPAEQRRWQVQLSELVDAIVARAIEACAFDFPEEHPFWGPFTIGQDRDIALALSSLGFRFDGLGGFVDDRIPNQRDLSLATGYAGLDPMRIRHWPSESEMGDLFRDVTVAADEYLAGAAGGLTLGELVTLLGRRADSLTELWNAWGRVRPLLLEPI